MDSYRICTRCVMDTSDPGIEFDGNGVCNHCRGAEKELAKEPYCLPAVEKKKRLDALANRIRERGRGKKYDCVIGLSGGVDSSYVALLVKDLGLRPLAVHLDNGWNSELSVANIENICKTLGIDLNTYVINWREFKDLQLSFLKASTPDSEVPSDHAIRAILVKVARKNGIGYIVAGTNKSSESILPNAWSQGHDDWLYIKTVQETFGTEKLRTFPHFGLARSALDRFMRKAEWIDILDYVDYDKEKAKAVIAEKLGWRDYGRKHGESNYTRIYQEHILPLKFGYDKRRAHLSSLIVAGQLGRARALEMLKEPLYPDAKKLNEDIEYLCNKFGISRGEFDRIMAAPPRRYEDYTKARNAWWFRAARALANPFRKAVR